MNNKPVKMIGFDLGHGEISLAKIQANQNDLEPPKPMLLHNQRYQPAAIAYHPTQGVLFGKPAYSLDGDNEFEIAFKKKPPLTSHDSKTLQNFVKAIHTHLIQTNQLDEEYNNHFFVGCPSGWKDEEVAAYEKILSSYLPVVKVIPESRAALMHAKESGLFTMKELSESVLVIDVGSSTTDLTLIKGRNSEPIKDSGIELGASLIDKAILDYTLDKHPNKQQIQDFFQKISAYRHRCELWCRKAKEEYFDSENSYQERMVNVGYEKFQQTGIMFEPRINKSIMEEILNQKLSHLDKDWITYFRDLLTKTKQELDKKNIQLSAVFLTGSASKMSFISKIVKDVFQESRFQPDSEPELSIAFGLARWGRISIRTQNFLKEVYQTIDQSLEDIVRSDIDTLKDALTPTLTDGLLNVIEPCMHAWREGDIQILNDLQPEIQNRALSWLEEPETKKQIEENILTWINEVQEKLKTEINPICKKYKLPSGNIQLELITSWTTIKDSLPLMSNEKLTPTVDFITGTLLPIITGVVPALFFGPIGLLIGIPAFVSREKTKEFLSNQNFPVWIRKKILTDNKIDEIIEEKQLDLNNSIKDKLDEQQPVLIKNLVEDLSKQIKAGIKKEADNVSLLIA